MADQDRTLVIDVELDDKDLKRGSKAAKKEMSSIGKAAKSLGPIIAGAFGTAALVGFVKQTLEVNDALAKTADRLGITTEAMAGFNLAAELGGMSAQQMSTSLQMMNRNVSDAAKGMGLAKDSLIDLGLSAERLREIGPEQAFVEIVGALENVENAADRSNIAMDIFGRSGGQVLNLTAEGLAKARQEAEAFGTAISRDQAKQIEDFNDEMTRLAAAGQGIANEFTIALLPALTAVVTSMQDGAREGSSLSFVIDGVAGVFNTFTIGLLTTTEILGAVGDSIGAVGAALSFLAEGELQLASNALEEFGVDAEARLISLSQRIQNIDLFGTQGVTAPAGAETGGVSTAISEAVEVQTTSAADRLIQQVQAEQEAADLINQTWSETYANQTTAFSTESEKRAFIAQLEADSVVGIASQTGQALDTLGKVGFEKQKGFAVGQGLMNTYESAVAAYKSLAGIPVVGPALGAAAAAAATAAGLKNVATIKKQKPGGSGGGGGAVPASVSGGAGGVGAAAIPGQPAQNIPAAVPGPEIRVISNDSIVGKMVEEEVIPAINDALRRGISLDLELN
jgi:hypothetical protein